MKPQLEEVPSDIGDRAGVSADHLKIFLCHSPARGLLCCKDGWVAETTL